ncbi:MAG: hypothetical protein JXL80_11770 [Planctomycetes bacterium]|nr:hypothetical protein [Planctomycetota bacterium]
MAATDPSLAAPDLYALYGWAETYVKHAEDMKRLGVRWARIGGWEHKEWADKAALLAARNGVHLTPTLIMQEISYGKTMPVEASIKLWRERVRENVLRYGPGGTLWKENADQPALPIRYWQIWNEPNIDFLTPPNDETLRTELYAKLLAAASEEIRKIDSHAIIVGFNTASGTPDRGQALKADGMFQRLKYIGWRKFIRDVATATGPKPFDAVGIHPYTQPLGPEEGGVIQGMGMLEEVAKPLRFADKPVWFTEIGWPLEYPNKKQVRDERQQACFLVRLFGLSAAHQVAQVQIMYMTDIVYSKDNTRRSFGLFLAPGKWREQAAALRIMVRLMPEPRKDAKIVAEEAGGVFAYELSGATGQPVLMAWHTGTGQVEREFPAADGPLTLVDMLGKTSELKAQGGKVRLTLGEAPVYVVRGSAAEVAGQLARE